MSNAIANHNGQQAVAAVAPANDRAFEPANLDQAMTLAKVLWAGKMLPKHLSTPEAVVTAIIMGRELGLSVMQSVRGIHIVEGKPALSADAMLAVVKASPACEYFRLVESNADRATYETKRRGEPAPTSMTFTAQEAQDAGLLGKDNWRKYRPAMLRARCSSALARAVYQDIVMGVYDPDELEPAPRTAATVTVVEDGRTVDTVTGEVVTPDAGMAAFGGQDNQQPQQTQRKKSGRAILWETACEVLPDEPPGMRQDTLTALIATRFDGRKSEQLTDAESRDLAADLRKPDYLATVLKQVQEALHETALKYLFASVNEAAKACEITAAEADDCRKNLLKDRFGVDSANDARADQLRLLAECLRTDPRVLLDGLPVPAFDAEAPFEDGHTGSAASLEAEG